MEVKKNHILIFRRLPLKQISFLKDIIDLNTFPQCKHALFFHSLRYNKCKLYFQSSYIIL